MVYKRSTDRISCDRAVAYTCLECSEAVETKAGRTQGCYHSLARASKMAVRD